MDSIGEHISGSAETIVYDNSDDMEVYSGDIQCTIECLIEIDQVYQEMIVTNDISDNENGLVIDGLDREWGYGGIPDIWAISSCSTGPYAPIYLIEGMIRNPSPSHIRHTIGGLPSQMNLGSQFYELSFETDQHLSAYLYNGIVNDFKIVDKDAYIEPYYCRNYKSVLTQPCFGGIMVSHGGLGRRKNFCTMLGLVSASNALHLCLHKLATLW